MSIPLPAHTTFDKVKKSILGEKITLTSKQLEIKRRWTAAFNFMLDGGLRSDREVAKFLMDQFGIGETKAYEDIAASKKLFGDVRKSHKEAERYVASENAKKQFEFAIDKYKETGKSYWINYAIEQQKIHLKVNVLEKDDPDMPDPDKIQPPVQLIQLNIDFITSKFADVIDQKAKKKINALLKEIQKVVDNNLIDNYLDHTVDVPLIEVKKDDKR